MRNSLLVAAAVVIALGSHAFGQTPYIVRDMSQGSGTSSAGSEVDETIMLNGVAIFAGRDGLNGRELWRSDGTVAGTYLLMDIRPGTNDSLPQDFVAHDDFVYFTADDGVRGRELWRTDGTNAGTGIVRDFWPGPGSSAVDPVCSVNGKLYVNANTGSGSSPRGLWESDGTADGTHLISVLSSCCLQDGTCVFVATSECAAQNGRWLPAGTACAPGSCPAPLVVCCLPDDVCELRTRDSCIGAGGTPAPTGQSCEAAVSCNSQTVRCCLPDSNCQWFSFQQCVKAGGLPYLDFDGCSNGCPFPTGLPGAEALTPLVDVGGVFVFGSPGTLWAMDAEEHTASVIASFAPLTQVHWMLGHDGKAFFSAQTTAQGRELWVTDGTAAGTTIVADIFPGSSSGVDTPTGQNAAEIVALGDAVMFRANDGVTGWELWRTDGTAAATSKVVDLHTQTGGSTPRRFSIFNGNLFFIAQIPGSAEALIRTDGTSAGTVVVKTGFTNTTDFNIRNGTKLVHNGLLYFSASTAAHGRELWRSDGTDTGTILLRDEPGGGAAVPGAMMGFADKIVYAADRPNSGRELWQTDGTPVGTIFFADLNTRSPGFDTEIRAGIGEVAFLRAPTVSNGLELHRTAGTAATTWMVKDIAAGSESTTIDEMIMFDGRLLFTATRTTAPAFSRALWSSDGTESGTVPVGELAPPGGTGGVADVGIEFGGYLLFVGGTGYTGSELWRSDGTAAGTVQVKDIRPGILSGLDLPRVFVEFGGLVYFGANDGTNGGELWRTDGTTAGTQMFADLTPGSGGGAVPEFCVFGDTLLFTYANTLWRTDGTVAGTFSLNAGSGPGLPTRYFEFDGAVYFSGRTGSTGHELWKTDGTLAGTTLVKDIFTGTSDSLPQGFRVYNGELIFVASSASGLDIWRTDGTALGTTLALDLANSVQPLELLEYGGQLYFTQQNSGRIWRTDLTPEGTVMFLSSGHNVPPGNFLEHGGLLYFISGSNYPATGSEIWQTDGTEAGTHVSLDLVAGVGNSDPGRLTVVGDRFVFAAATAANGREYWTFDPATMVAERITDIALGTASSNPTALAAQGGQLYFSAFNPNTGSALYHTDGTLGGTSIVLDPDVYRPVLTGANLTATDTHLFLTDTGQTPRTLYATDGTAEGNVRVRMFPHPGELRSLVSLDGELYLGANDTGVGLELHHAAPVENGTTLVTDFYSGPTGSGPLGAAQVGDEMFFAADPGTGVGRELCASDGTSAGTRLVKDIEFGTNGSNPSGFVDLNGIAVFVATTGGEGQEIWRSDGTEAGTYMLRDIKPGPAGSAPQNLTVLPGRVLFTADDGEHGRELWSTNGTTVLTLMLGDLWEGPGGSQPAWITRAPGRIFFTAYTPETGTEFWTSNGSAFGTAQVIDLVEGPSSAAVTRLTVAGSHLYFFATAAPSPTALWAVEWNSAVSEICFADYDHSGGIGVPDIFAFLSDWFATQPRADVDGNGAVAVPDIFAFLTLWFASCD